MKHNVLIALSILSILVFVPFHSAKSNDLSDAEIFNSGYNLNFHSVLQALSAKGVLSSGIAGTDTCTSSESGN